MDFNLKTLDFQLDEPTPLYLLDQVVKDGIAAQSSGATFPFVAQKYFAKHGTLPFYLLKEQVASFMSGIAMPKHLYALKDLLDPTFHHLVDNGHIQNFFDKCNPPEGKPDPTLCHN